MNNENDSNSQVAEDYIDRQLAKARVAVVRSKQFGVLLTVLICGYFSVLTYILNGFLEPTTVADVAVGTASQLVQEKAGELSKSVETEARNYLHSLPDTLLAKLPDLRLEMERHLLNYARVECRRHAEKLGEELDAFLLENAGTVQELLTKSDDPAELQALAEQLGEEFVASLEIAPDGRESMNDKIRMTLSGLDRIEQQLERLAEGRNLTPGEQNQRRAIAMVAALADRGL
jgi:hypothetical protein